jgi:hypothetical protein
MNFGQAIEIMREGKKVRLPEWKGFWYKKNGQVYVHLEDGTENNTPWFQQTIWREDWEIAE